jgi:streptogramin lyase
MASVKRLLSTTVVALAASGGVAQAATITEFPLPVANRQPAGIAAGPDGNVWFTESANPGAIGRITPTGTISSFSTGLTTNSDPLGIAAGADGNLWFTESANPGAIGKITPSGTITESRMGLTNDSDPTSITAGPDGNLWFTEQSTSYIGRITPSGSATEYSGLSAAASSVATGPDGKLWFTEPSAGKIARVAPATPSSPIESSSGSPNNHPTSIAAGPDGNLWFTESFNPAAIGRITPTGTVTSFSTGLTANSDPSSITAGPDGNLWFTESVNPGRIGRITPTGTITEYTTGLTANSDPVDIAAANGALWFSELSNPGRIGRLTPDAPSAITQAASAVTPTTASLTGTVNPNSSATTYHFDFGATTAYGQRSPAADAVVGADTAAHAVAQSLTGLLPSTTYHYRSVATSSTGTAYGADATFTTSAQPPSLTTTSNPIAPPMGTPVPVPIPAPVPAPAPTGPPVPPVPPTIGRTAVAGVVSGTVLVRIPGSLTLRPLGAAQNVPMGSLLNAINGVVKVTDAIDRKGHTQSATVWAGSFLMTQARAGRGMTTFKLAGSLSCPSPHSMTTAAARSSKPVRLWGKDNHGRYSTRGRNSVATVRGTVWETVESCAGTRTIVKQGVVSVRDLHRRTSVLVHAGHSYLARR